MSIYGHGIAAVDFSHLPVRRVFLVCVQRPLATSILLPVGFGEKAVEGVGNETRRPFFGYVGVQAHRQSFVPFVLQSCAPDALLAHAPFKACAARLRHVRHFDVVLEVFAEVVVLHIGFVVFGHVEGVGTFLARVSTVERQAGKGHPAAQRQRQDVRVHFVPGAPRRTLTQYYVVNLK